MMRTPFAGGITARCNWTMAMFSMAFRYSGL